MTDPLPLRTYSIINYCANCNQVQEIKIPFGKVSGDAAIREVCKRCGVSGQQVADYWKSRQADMAIGMPVGTVIK